MTSAHRFGFYRLELPTCCSDSQLGLVARGSVATLSMRSESASVAATAPVAAKPLAMRIRRGMLQPIVAAWLFEAPFGRAACCVDPAIITHLYHITPLSNHLLS